MNDFTKVPEVIIPIVAILMPVGIIAVVAHFKNKEREMIHRERMAALEKGLQPPVELEPSVFSRRPHGPRNYLLRGLVWLFVGLGALAPVFLFRDPWGERIAPQILSLPFLGLIPAGVGLAYLVFYAIEGSKPRPPTP
jgi:hypothetical protein